MGYTYTFFDNQTIGSSHLNSLAKRFVTEGVADIFTDGVPYNLSVLNSIIYANASDGVVPENDTSLKVSLSGDMVFISKGSAFFADGTVMDVDTEGITLPYNKGRKNYVYIISDNSLNCCKAECSLEEKEGNVLLLALIDEKGDVMDKRKYAKGKLLSSYASSMGLTLKTTLSWYGEQITNKESREIVLNNNGARGLFYCTSHHQSSNVFGFVLFDNNGKAHTYYSGLTKDFGNPYNNDYIKSENALVLDNDLDRGNLLIATAEVSDNKIVITPTIGRTNIQSAANFDFYVF